MTFLAPGFLYAAIAGVVAVIALHLIVTHQPRAIVLPTARFVPDVPAAATSRAVRPYDLLLLLLRVLLLLAVGSALARPILKPRRERIARVIVADVSGSVANPVEVADSVRRLYRPGDVIVIFDSAARARATGDSLGDSLLHAVSMRATVGSLSAALVGALRAAPTVRDGADSVELVLVSAFVSAERDFATGPIGALWPGRARLVHVAADTAAAARDPQLSWDVATRPAMAIRVARLDTSGAVIAGNDVVVAPLQRRWSFPPDSLRGATVVARWVDGTPAAVERDSQSEAGCQRSIAIPVDSVGDLILRPEFVRLRQTLTGPCRSIGASDTPGTSVVAGDSVIRSLTGSGKLASAALFPAPMDVQSPIAPWLIAAALTLAFVEVIVRRQRGDR
ncbi:MAG: BatA domain-containing protein [Gemmatimonadaceae bacterium]